MKIASSTQRLISFSLLTSLVLIICACGGGDSENSGPALLTGEFIDSPVAGLTYSTSTRSGVTDVNGAFLYLEGEIVTFSIGGIVIGQAPGNYVLTPIDIVDGAIDDSDDTVINVIRLLQSLDSDCNPDNGIFLNDETIAEIQNRSIDFTLPKEDFAVDVDVEALIITINALDLLDGCVATLRSENLARNHLRKTLGLPPILITPDWPWPPILQPDDPPCSDGDCGLIVGSG